MIVTLLLVIIYLSFISLGLPDSLLGAAWPSMHATLPVSVSSAGILSMIISGGTVISSLLSARMIKRLGTGMVTAFSVALTATALLGFSFAGSFIVLCMWALPLGLGAGSVDAALNNYVATHYKARHMSWLHCFWGIGAATGPVIMAYYLLNAGAWRLGYRVIGVIQWGLVVILFLSLPLWKKGGGSAEETRPVESDHPTLKLASLLRIPGAKSAMASFFCYCAIESTTGLWGSSYLVLVKHISPELAAQWISFYYIGITMGRLFSGFLTIKLDHRRMIPLGEGLLAGGIIFILLPFGNVSLLGGFLLLGLGCAPIFPSLLHETPVNFGHEHSQAMMGVQMACAYIGATLMPPLFGVIASRIGYAIFPAYLCILLLIMVAMVVTLNKKVGVIPK